MVVITFFGFWTFFFSKCVAYVLLKNESEVTGVYRPDGPIFSSIYKKYVMLVGSFRRLLEFLVFSLQFGKYKANERNMKLCFLLSSKKGRLCMFYTVFNFCFVFFFIIRKRVVRLLLLLLLMCRIFFGIICTENLRILLH